jgi:hypothetical protein
VRRDLQARVFGPQARRKLLGDTGCRPEQEEPETTARAHRRQRWDEVDACDRRVQPAALAPRRPNDACAVGQAKVGRFQDAGEVRVFARPHDELRIHRGDEVMAAGLDELFDAAERRLHVDAVDADPQDADLGQQDTSYFASRGAGLFIGGMSMPTVSKVSAVTTVCGIGAPRLVANSGSPSPPPTRTRVQV